MQSTNNLPDQNIENKKTKDPKKNKKWRQRHRILWGLSWLVGGIFGLITASIVGIFVFANTEAGQQYIAKQIGELTSHSVEVSGLTGSFPNHLQVALVELKDPNHKTWLSLKNVKLDWSLASLLTKYVNIDQLSAKEINVYFIPKSEPTETPASSTTLPDITIAAHIGRLKVDKVFVAKSVAPVDLNIGIHGSADVKNIMPLIGFSSLQAISNIRLDLHIWELNQATDLKLSVLTGDQKVDQANLVIQVKKNQHSLIERLLQNDHLLPLSLNLGIKGPYNNLQTNLALVADKTNLNAKGNVDVLNSKMNIVLSGHSPAMIIMPNIGWGGWTLDANIHGAFSSPAGKGEFELNDLVAGDAMVNHLTLNFMGKDLASSMDQEHKISPCVRLNMVADGLRIPGSQPRLLARSPLNLDVVYHPTEKDVPIDIRLQHELIKAVGRVFIEPSPYGSIDLSLPNLGALAAIGGVDIKGYSVLNIGFKLPEDSKNPIHFDLDGPVVISGGLPAAVKMVGSQGHIGLHATMVQSDKQNIQLQALDVKGDRLSLHADGSLLADQVKGLLNLNINDLSGLSPIVKGKTEAQVNIDGSLQDLAAKLKLTTTVSTDAKSGYVLRPSQFELTANAQHLPSQPQVEMVLKGELDKSPLSLQLQAGMRSEQQDYYLKLQELNWRSLNGTADVTLSQKTMLPIGNIKIEMARLGDVAKIIHQAIDGSIRLNIRTMSEGKPKVMVNLDGKVNMPQAKVGQIALSGSVDNPIEKPQVNLKLQVNQLQAPQVKGNVSMAALGGMDDLKLTLKGAFPSLIDAKGNIDTALTLNLDKKKVSIQKLNALVKGETIRLLAPVTAEFGEKMGLDRLRLSVAPAGSPTAMIDIAGSIKPTLSLNASIQNITPALAKPFAPDLKAQGIINAQAKLSGSIEKPQGNIRVNAQNMKLLTGPAASLPAAQLTAQADLNGNNARLNTSLQVGKKINATVQGNVPLKPKGNLALQLNGNVDLSVANAIVGASGQQVKGLINLAMQVNGNMTSPSITGNVNLSNGSFRDYAQGVTIRDIQASIIGQRDHIILQSFSAKAGKGTMNANGEVGIFQPGLPVNIHFGMKGAQPLISDLLTASLDGDINVKGMAKTRIDVDGIVKIKRADINIPRSVSRSIVPLKVIRPGDKTEDTAQASSGAGPIIGLNLTIKTAGQIIIRGFGLFTDLAGSLHIGGTSQAPQITGGFQMKNGHIDLAGISLEFTKGKIGFKGSSVDHKIDPSLDFEVSKSVNGNKVSLTITGYASSPKIALTSSPPLSQDRVLAMLIFGVDSQSLSATQMAEIGVALATLGGEGSGFDPLGTIRKSLGLDRFSVGGGGSDSKTGSSTGTSVSAGKYIMKGVYLGAKQSTGDAGTQAEVQVDITKRLKATATVGTGNTNSNFVTPDNDPGSSIGLLYKFDY